jgi:Pyruvate/2-oxoacid:ferredoxin oxidoreductase gamma subunit
MRVEFRLSGSGGQGLLLAGIVLAEAAILDDKNAVQTQSYGPEARGGASKAEVVVSDEEIDYPKAVDPDYLLALTPESYRTYGPLMGKGLIIVDSSCPSQADIAARTVAVPILETPATRNRQEGRRQHGGPRRPRRAVQGREPGESRGRGAQPRAQGHRGAQPKRAPGGPSSWPNGVCPARCAKDEDRRRAIPIS